MTDDILKRSKRGYSIHPRGSWVPARTVYSAGGSPVPIDGIIGFDGIPIGLPNRRVARQKKERVAKRRGTERMNWFSKYPLTVCYVTTLMFIGCLAEGWVGWLLP